MSAPPSPLRRASHRRRRVLAVPRFAQPDDVTCGPTCLLQVYRYYGDEEPFGRIARSVRRNADGGTLAVYLGLAALERGYRVRITSWNLRVFDPTWTHLAPGALRNKLRERAAAVRSAKLRDLVHAYDDFLRDGGEVSFGIDLTPGLLTRAIDRGHPMLAGLSATHLYRRVRERPHDNVDDDIRGEPMGHFVVVAGYTQGGATFLVRDPHRDAPLSKTGRYAVPAQRLTNAILLGDSTYDAVLLELWPERGPAGRRGRTP
jgi:Peptidase_C39 like family